jgi:hypothetical protein
LKEAEHEPTRHAGVLVRRHEGYLTLADVEAALVAEDYLTPLVEGAPPARYMWAQVGPTIVHLSDVVLLADALRAAELPTGRRSRIRPARNRREGSPTAR